MKSGGSRPLAFGAAVALAVAVGIVLACPVGAIAAGYAYFQTPRQIDPPGIASITDVESMDVDIDGDTDLVASCYATAELMVFKNSGTGTFSFFESSDTLGRGALTLALANLDGDSYVDHLVATDDGWVRRSFGDTDGGIAAGRGFQWIDMGSATRDVGDIAVIYLPGDYLADFAVTIPSADEVRVFRNNGSGTFNLAAVLPLPVGSEPQGIVGGYLVGDDNLDLAIAAYGTDRLLVYAGAGDGSFSLSSNLTAGDSPWDVALTRIDENTRFSLAVTNRWAGTVSVRTRSTSDFWELLETYTVGGAPLGLAAGPISPADPYPELAILDSTGNKIRILCCTGESPTVSTHQPATHAHALGVHLSDIDDNNKLDAITWGGDRISVYPNASWPLTQRIAGTDRYRTSAAISREFFWARTQVVVATGEDFPDALTGAPLAGMLDAPVLLTRRDALPGEIAAEVSRLGATTAYILGGRSSVGLGVERDLRDAGIITIRRLAGDNRYDTAGMVAREMEMLSMDDIDEAFITTGSNYPDALAAGPLGASWDIPILLVRKDSIPPETASAITGLALADTWVLGNSTSVGSSVFGSLPSPARLSGNDRYATAKAIADWGLGRGAIDYLSMLATGENFPDALSLGAVGGRWPLTLMLTRRTSVPPATAAFASARMARMCVVPIAGGTSSISNSTVNAYVTGY